MIRQLLKDAKREHPILFMFVIANIVMLYISGIATQRLENDQNEDIKYIKNTGLALLICLSLALALLYLVVFHEAENIIIGIALIALAIALLIIPIILVSTLNKQTDDSQAVKIAKYTSIVQTALLYSTFAYYLDVHLYIYYTFYLIARLFGLVN